MSAGDRPVLSALLYGSDGTPIAYKEGGELAVVSRGIDKDLVAGARDSYITSTTTATSVLRSSFWTDPGNQAQRSIKSTSAADVGGNTGIWAVRVTYYAHDGSGPFTEDITLLGQTPVATVATNIRFIERIEALTVGAANGAEGAIDLVSGNDGTGDSLGRINVGESSTKWAQHWVPPGASANITSIFSSGRSTGGVGTGAHGRIMLRKQSLITLKFATVDIISGIRVVPDEPVASLTPAQPIRVDGPAMLSLWVRADGTAATEWFAGFSFFDS